MVNFLQSHPFYCQKLQYFGKTKLQKIVTSLKELFNKNKNRKQSHQSRRNESGTQVFVTKFDDIAVAWEGNRFDPNS